MSDSTIAITQIVVAATVAFAFAHYVLGHEVPLLAGTVCVSSLGLVRDARPVRVLETVIGMVVGILIADLLRAVVGIGWWQFAVTLGATLIIARFLSPEPAFALAAAIQSLIVMIIPASAPLQRLTDGIVGGVAALLVTALIPRNPVTSAARDAKAFFAGFASTAGTIIQALHAGDRVRAERALTKARGLQGRVDEWKVTLDTARAVSRISPFLRRGRSELERQERIRANMDFASRNLRVVARRVVYLCDDGQPRQAAADTLRDIIRGADAISRSLSDIEQEVPAREMLRAVARRLHPGEVVQDASVVDQTLIGAFRPLTVDLMTAAGVPAVDARASLPRV